MEARPSEIPLPPPEIPKFRFWSALVFPPLIPTAGALWVVLLPPADGGGRVLAWIPAALFVAIIIGLALFNSAIAERYRGISKTFLGWVFFLGQTIIGLALWTASFFALESAP